MALQAPSLKHWIFWSYPQKLGQSECQKNKGGCIICLSMLNKISLKFTFGFLGILVVAMVGLVVTCYFDDNTMGEPVPEMNLADKIAIE